VLIAFHKPWGVLSQFTPDGSPNRTLAEFGLPPRVYPLGRLDADSEGLLLLSDEPALNQRLLHPRHGHRRLYWAQVERVPDAAALVRLQRGVAVQGRRTLPCRAWILDPQPEVPPREPPIRFRKSVPTCWLGVELVEGRNRQVRRMTAAIGHPTLRLLRVRIGELDLGDLPSGAWRTLTQRERARVLGATRGNPGPGAPPKGRALGVSPKPSPWAHRSMLRSAIRAYAIATGRLGSKPVPAAGPRGTAPGLR
jgi:23S rRNA pseudouridine2457 synthase